MLDLAESYVLLNRSGKTQRDLLRGRTLINLFFEDSHPHAHQLRVGGQAAGSGRNQYVGLDLLGEQG